MKKVFKATRKDQYVQPVEFDPGRYTFHAAVKGEAYSFALKTENGVWLSFDLSWQLEDGEWSRITHTFDLTEKCVEFSLFASETASEVLIGDPMFEEGNNRSTPSVSPLDLDEVSENISERVTVNFDVLDDRINANVTAITNAVDDISGITTRVSEAESEISVQAGIIEQKADKTEVTALGTTVTSLGLIVDAHTGQIASKVSQTEYNEFGDQVSNQFSQINQRAGEIEISVSSLDEKVDENKGLSEAYADSAAASAESAAKRYAEAKAESERVIAEAYADGIVDAEEQARIDDVNAKLATAKAYAEAQDAILKDQQEDYADQAAASAIDAAAIDAQNRAEAQALWAKTEAGSYTDGEITTLNNQLLDTGINIQQQLITITADNTIFRDNQGNPIALFNPSWTKIQASAIELEGLVTVNSKFKVLLDGSIEAVDGKFTGIINAASGEIGGFAISSGRIGVVQSGNNPTTDGMAIYNDFIKFSNSSASVFVGINVLPATTGTTAMMRLTDGRTGWGYKYGAIIEVSGSNSVDGTNNNIALDIVKGVTRGLRWAILALNLTSNRTFGRETELVCYLSASGRIVYLPSSPEIGELKIVTRVNNYNLTVNGNGKTILWGATNSGSVISFGPSHDINVMTLTFRWDGTHWLTAGW